MAASRPLPRASGPRPSVLWCRNGICWPRVADLGPPIFDRRGCLPRRAHPTEAIMNPVRSTMLEPRLEPRSRRTIVRFAVVALAALVLLAAAAPWNPPALSAPNYTLKLIAGSYGPF